MIEAAGRQVLGGGVGSAAANNETGSGTRSSTGQSRRDHHGLWPHAIGVQYLVSCGDARLAGRRDRDQSVETSPCPNNFLGPAEVRRTGVAPGELGRGSSFSTTRRLSCRYAPQGPLGDPSARRRVAVLFMAGVASAQERPLASGPHQRAPRGPRTLESRLHYSRRRPAFPCSSAWTYRERHQRHDAAAADFVFTNHKLPYGVRFSRLPRHRPLAGEPIHA